MPASVLVLVLDDLGASGHALLLGCSLRRRQRRRVRREGLGEHAVDLVGPAAVVLDDFVRDVRHHSPDGLRAAPKSEHIAKAAACTDNENGRARFRALVLDDVGLAGHALLARARLAMVALLKTSCPQLRQFLPAEHVYESGAGKRMRLPKIIPFDASATVHHAAALFI